MTAQFDIEDVDVNLGYNASGLIEATGPDYEFTVDDDEDVLFTDSPCVRRWESVTVKQNSTFYIYDDYCATPISGWEDTVFCSPPTGALREALYVKDLVIESGATLYTGFTKLGQDVERRVFYTGSVTNNGSLKHPDGSTTFAIQLNPTLYGDFDGTDDGDETDDINRFNAAFCTCFDDEDYDALVDWNCDGRIDDDDRDQFNSNWGDPEEVTDATCEDPCGE